MVAFEPDSSEDISVDFLRHSIPPLQIMDLGSKLFFSDIFSYARGKYSAFVKVSIVISARIFWFEIVYFFRFTGVVLATKNNTIKLINNSLVKNLNLKHILQKICIM